MRILHLEVVEGGVLGMQITAWSKKTLADKLARADNMSARGEPWPCRLRFDTFVLRYYPQAKPFVTDLRVQTFMGMYADASLRSTGDFINGLTLPEEALGEGFRVSGAFLCVTPGSFWFRFAHGDGVLQSFMTCRSGVPVLLAA